MKLSDIRLDVAIIEAGDWEDVPAELFPGMDGVRFKVRGTGNADYRRLQGKLLRGIAAKKLAPDKEQLAAEQIGGELLAKTVLLDWSGIEDEGGAALAYSPDIAAQFLADPEMRIFRDAVAHCGNLVANRKKAARSDAEKN